MYRAIISSLFLGSFLIAAMPARADLCRVNFAEQTSPLEILYGQDDTGRVRSIVLCLRWIEGGEEFACYNICEGVGSDVQVEITGTPYGDIIRRCRTSDVCGDTLVPASGWDRFILNGIGGDDELYGTDGSDIIFGGEGCDRMWGFAGNDYLYLGNINSSCGDIEGAWGHGGDDEMWGTGGPDLLDSGQGADTLHGLGDDDVLLGGPGDDILYGGRGNDTVCGHHCQENEEEFDGYDQLLGEEGDDILCDRSANDNADDFIGGTGYDVGEFCFSAFEHCDFEEQSPSGCSDARDNFLDYLN